MILKRKYKGRRIGQEGEQVSISLLVRRSKREVRATYYGDEEKDMVKKGNCNRSHL